VFLRVNLFLQIFNPSRVEPGVFAAVSVRYADVGSPEKSAFDQYILKVKVTFDTTPVYKGEELRF